MTRSQAAYLRIVKAQLAKMGKADRFDATRAMALYDAWVKAPAAATQLAAAPLRERLCTPMTVGEASIAASTVR